MSSLKTGGKGHGPLDGTGAGSSPEFPPGASRWPDTLSRRGFLELMGASLALVGVEGCSTRQPAEAILPYANAPERLLPGKPQYYATSMDMAGTSIGLLVKSDMGRPIKIEGNPDHPSSLGATDAFAQASLLGLYDPQRSRTVLQEGGISDWESFTAALETSRRGWKEKKGEGLRILTGKISSPTLLASLGDLLSEYPSARWHESEPMDSDQVGQGTELFFGRRLRMIPRFDRAEVIVSLDADFLDWAPGRIRFMHDFALGRDPEGASPMSRLYMVETAHSLTGANADHRLALPPRALLAWARMLARELDIAMPDPAGDDAVDDPALSRRMETWAKQVAKDLSAHRGKCLVLGGEPQPPWMHALAHALNHKLGNLGNTLAFTSQADDPEIPRPQSLAPLVADMLSGKVETLLILGGNPAYASPADLEFPKALAHVPNAIHYGSYADETAVLCRWHVPAAHFLESWGDGRSHEGTVSLVQPLIQPLHFAKTGTEMIAALAGRPNASAYDILRAHWQAMQSGPGFQAFWNRSLQLGLMEGSAWPEETVQPRSGWETLFSALPALPNRTVNGMTISFRPDATVWDGRFTENAWLQELPKPLTKLTWDNAIYLAPATAANLGLGNGDEVELECDGRRLTGPIWTATGHAEGCLTVTFGYGRTHAGKVGNGLGYNAYALRTLAAPWVSEGVTLRRTGRKIKLACTQDHQSLEGRDLVKHATMEELENRPRASTVIDTLPTLYPPVPVAAYAWGMTVDLSLCTGCSACVIACQAENNIPVVGKEQVALGREMHWIRIDRYFQASEDDVRTLFQPLACVHCENAPCELVCPVEATLHSPEGLNEMIYNRCIGTRYCSNNCPYKVRRFNFFQYVERGPDGLKPMRNPDVTVRSRGVMEKCSYCVQRIERVRIRSEREDRSIRDGEVVTACQQACPSKAIRFGNRNDAESRVAQTTRNPRNFTLLQELNTRPRTTYLTRVTNPDPGFPRDAHAS